MIKIDADTFFRALTATGYKVLAYHLNLDTGEITSRTLRPDETPPAPLGPSVKPLPKLGGDLTPKKDSLPFGPTPVSGEPKKKLFADDDGPKKPNFQEGFWKREEKKKTGLFAEEFKRESGSRKLAEIFSDAKPVQKPDPFAKPTGQRNGETGRRSEVIDRQVSPSPVLPVSPSISTERAPRIPAATDSQQLDWMRAYAKDCGDPEIRELLLKALSSPKPVPAFERVLRNYQRTGQQWERYYRKQALACGEAWLSDFGIAWELVESSDQRA